MMFCLPTKCQYIQTTLFGTVLQEKVGTIYDHPSMSSSSSCTTSDRGSGKSKATVIRRTSNFA